MKKLMLSAVLLLQFSTTQARAAEVSLIGVVGAVGTMAIVGLVLSTSGTAVLKGELIEEAIDVLAMQDIEAISLELKKVIRETQERTPETKTLNDLELLEVLVESSYLAK